MSHVSYKPVANTVFSCVVTERQWGYRLYVSLQTTHYVENLAAFVSVFTC